MEQNSVDIFAVFYRQKDAKRWDVALKKGDFDMIKAAFLKFLRLFGWAVDLLRALERFLQAWIKKLTGAAERLYSFLRGLYNQTWLYEQEKVI